MQLLNHRKALKLTIGVLMMTLVCAGDASVANAADVSAGATTNAAAIASAGVATNVADVAGTGAVASVVEKARGIRPAEGEVPKLVLGLVSDTHIMMSYRGKGFSQRLNGTGFKQALECFREAKVDAVVHCGDWAHRGHIREMELSRDVWKSVFPRDSLPDGKKVAKLFVTGNHDYFDVNEKSLQAYKDPKVAKKKMLRSDMTNQWQRIWGMPFVDEGFKHCRHYEVKGYHFLAGHWSEKDYSELVKFAKNLRQGGVLTDSKPIFVLTHSVLTASVRRYFSKNFRNSFNFFGHWHKPHSVDNYDVNHGGHGIKCVQIPCSRKDCPTRHGYIVKVYEKCIVYECWDFNAKRRILPDWIKPLR